MLSNKLKQLEEQKKSHDNQQAEYIIFKRKFNTFLESIKIAPINVIELITFAIEKVIIEKKKIQKNLLLMFIINLNHFRANIMFVLFLMLSTLFIT